MDAIYRRTERWSDLIGVFRRRIELAEVGADRENLYAAMAEVYETRLGQPTLAIAAYREVLGLDEASRVALAALDGLFTRQAMWEELADNLEAQLRLAYDEGEQIQLMLRLAALRESKMEMIEPAIEGYSQVLEREPSNPDALAALERLGQTPEHELEIAEILEPLYRSAGAYMKLVGVHEVQVRRSDDPTRRVELLHQIATLYEDAGGDLASGFDTHARALAEDPSNPATQDSLDRLARATGRFADLARVFETLAQKQSDTELASTLFTMSARVYETDIGDLDSAIRHYRTVLQIDPKNLPAAESLDRIFRAAERYQELSEILQLKAEILDDAAEKKAALFQAAGIEEDVLERHDHAIAVYGKILDLDAEDLGAIDALIKLYLGLSRWADLLAVYAKKADLVSDPQEKKLIYYQIGAVYERELRDVARSIDTYQRVLELDPDDREALGRLDVLYQTAENWPELLTVLQHEAELAPDPAEGISYQYRIAELYEKHLDDTDARHRALPRSAPGRSRAMGRRSTRSRASRRGGRIRSARRSCSSPSTTPRASGRSSSASSRCRSRAPRIRTRRWSSTTASRGSRRRCSRITAPRSRPTRARSSTTSPTRSRSRASSASRWSSPAGRTSPRSTTRSSTSSRRIPRASSSCARASRISSRLSSRTWRAPSSATAASSPPIRRTRSRSRRSTGSSP